MFYSHFPKELPTDCEKCESILLSRAMMTGKLRWLRHVLRMKDDRLSKIIPVGQPSRAKRQAGHA
jgi:hypothetical protein